VVLVGDRLFGMPTIADRVHVGLGGFGELERRAAPTAWVARTGSGAGLGGESMGRKVKAEELRVGGVVDLFPQHLASQSSNLCGRDRADHPPWQSASRNRVVVGDGHLLHDELPRLRYELERRPPAVPEFKTSDGRSVRFGQRK
jgi:hypothetical protein